MRAPIALHILLVLAAMGYHEFRLKKIDLGAPQVDFHTVVTVVLGDPRQDVMAPPSLADKRGRNRTTDLDAKKPLRRSDLLKMNVDWDTVVERNHATPELCLSSMLENAWKVQTLSLW